MQETCLNAAGHDKPWSRQHAREPGRARVPRVLWARAAAVRERAAVAGRGRVACVAAAYAGNSCCL